QPPRRARSPPTASPPGPQLQPRVAPIESRSPANGYATETAQFHRHAAGGGCQRNVYLGFGHRPGASRKRLAAITIVEFAALSSYAESCTAMGSCDLGGLAMRFPYFTRRRWNWLLGVACGVGCLFAGRQFISHAQSRTNEFLDFSYCGYAN